MARRPPSERTVPEFRVLGPLDAVAEGRALDLGSPKQRDLLAVLLINAGRVVSTAQLADELWYGEPPDRPEGTLQAYVSRLRKALGAHVLVTRAPGYMLDVRPDDVDASRFERLLTSGRDARVAGESDRARALLREALALWRGRALDGVRILAAEQEAARLESLRLECVEERIEAELALGAGAELVAELQALNAAEPLRERTAGQLATALYRAGRQSDALDVLQRIANELREQLGVDPSPALRTLEESILRQEPVLEPPSLVQMRADPASPRTFIGRVDELEEVTALLSEPGLLTLTGLGGTGKTRLAMSIADADAELEAMVELAPLRDGDLVFRQIATALGIDEAPGRRIEDLVIDKLAASEGLLVLDNCEHLAVAVSDAVLAFSVACPQLRILATSREPLGLSRERTWTLPAMRPEDATKLFAERAAVADPGVPLPFDSVTRICARVGGIPLAVELAAARTRVLTVDQIAERLGDVVRTIDPDERLHSALTWAVDELDPKDQRLFERLSVFAGSFTLEDAEAVCPDAEVVEADVLGSAARLVEMSVLTTEQHGDRMRYGMLEPVRQFAARRCSDPSALAARHLVWAMTTVRADDDELTGMVLDDLRAALGWAVTEANDPAAGLELACSLAGHWRIHGFYQEGLGWLGQAIKAASDDDPNIRHGHRRYGEIAHQAGRTDEAIAHGRTAIALAEAADDGHELAWATMSLGVAVSYEDPVQGVELYDRALGMARQIGDENLEMQTLHNLGVQAHEAGQNDVAWSRFSDALDLAERRDDTESIVLTKQCLARIALDRGDLDVARRLADESVALARRAHVARGIDHGLYLLGYIATHLGDLPRAHAYYEEMADFTRTLGNPSLHVQSLLCLADILRQRGMFDEAMRIALEARDIVAALDSVRASSEMNQVLADLYREKGDVERAAVCIIDALDASDAVGRPHWLLNAGTAALILDAGGADDTVVTLVGALDAIRRAEGRSGVEDWDSRLVRAVEGARPRLGPRLDECWARGTQMSVEEVTKEALAALVRMFPALRMA